MCPICKSQRLREVWVNTDYYYIYEIENNNPVRVAEFADICPGKGVFVACCGCGEKLFVGSILEYMRHNNAGN